jgi:hypothetical protein
MLAFHISLNDRLVGVRGVEDWSILDLIVMAKSHEPGAHHPDGLIEAKTGGMTSPDNDGRRYHVRWADLPLQVGSKLTIQIVDVPAADLPAKRYRSDAEVQEDPFTDEEAREYRYQSYLELKAEFAPSA